VPAITEAGRPIPYGPYGSREPLPPPGVVLAPGVRLSPAGDSRKRRASSPPPPAAERELTKAEGKRREFVKPPQCNRRSHTSIYHPSAVAACEVGESIFDHTCDETLGKPHAKFQNDAAAPDHGHCAHPLFARRLLSQRVAC
jgi:hypothetical protein